MALSKEPYKGTRDFFPNEKRIRDYIFSKMQETAKVFGYEPYDGPLIEEVELYKAKSGEELINEQIYSFTDRGERFVAIRPEMTPTLARMIAQIHKQVIKPIRWFSIPNLMRYEKPQKGRLREHWQFNCDIFGAREEYAALEILELIIHLMKSFNANESHFEILLNDRRIVDFVFTNLMKVTDEQAYRLYKIVDKSKKVSNEALDEMLSHLNLGPETLSIFKKYLALSSFEDVFKFLKDYSGDSILNDFQIFYQNLKNLKLDKYIRFSSTIVRGLDYYTGIVFEVFDKNPQNRRAICGGGAYANILKIFGEGPLPAIGFGLGDVTFTDFLTSANLLPQSLIKQNIDILLTIQEEKCLDKSLTLASTLRAHNISCIAEYDLIKANKAFPLAEKRGASLIGLMGENELSQNTIQIKNMNNREQYNISLENIETAAFEIKKLL